MASPATLCPQPLSLGVQYWLLLTVVFKYLLLIFFPSWCSPPGFPLPHGQVVPHVGLQLLHVHIAAAQNPKRAFMHGRPPSLLLAGGTPLSWNVRHALSVAATRPISPPPELVDSLPAVRRLRKPPAQVHPCHSGNCGSGSAGFGAHPYTTPHQGVSAFPLSGAVHAYVFCLLPSLLFEDMYQDL